MQRMHDVLAIALLTALVAGCSTSTTSPAESNGVPGTLGPPVVGDTPGPTGPVAIDPALLAILPREVDSIPVVESPEADSDALADDVLPTIASAAVGVIAVDADAKDLAIGYVVKLLPGAMSDNVFRDWRDSYDEGACAGDSQVVGNSQLTVNGNTVYIGTCATGLHTYHVWLKDRSILISIASTGDRHLGLAILQNLRK
jgi:hypothetical protein